jgi:hypothetical protein
MKIPQIHDSPTSSAPPEGESPALPITTKSTFPQRSTSGSPLRLSPKTVRIVLIGLNWILQHHQLFLAGRVPHARPDLRWRSDLVTKGRYQQRLMNVIGCLRTTLPAKDTIRGRLYRLTIVEISAMMLAVRVSGQALWAAEKSSWFVGNILGRLWLDALRAEQASYVSDRKEDLLFMEYLIQWLVGYACLRVPERRIRDAAFVGARKIVEANYRSRDNAYLSRTSRMSQTPKSLCTRNQPVTR